jgi:Leucine-rich repeat (LRR) protein
VEIIFSPVFEIANLNRCVNLRSLTLIGVGLRRLSNLACVARSLERLCLPENELTRIEGLYLPNLRELYLQSNQICRIEGLDGCPKLQRLWLTDNRVVKLENLHALGDLRELWLQGNRISRIQNLEPLANLESLHLANNRIADFKDLHRLAHLPNLRELSLVDADHGSNPVVRAEGYRQFVLCTLKTVRVLDAEAVTVSYCLPLLLSRDLVYRSD